MLNTFFRSPSAINKPNPKRGAAVNALIEFFIRENTLLYTAYMLAILVPSAAVADNMSKGIAPYNEAAILLINTSLLPFIAS
ncbi:hypothetical protein SDC9_143463 [bioreactor metagenome]|uniref:Uncharacterized protein n=1 Tax=bioreactor metagenome TaxID=1076179 RepID=A0A645E464_9ZZZZ